MPIKARIFTSLPISEFILCLNGLLTYIRECLKTISGREGGRKSEFSFFTEETG